MYIKQLIPWSGCKQGSRPPSFWPAWQPLVSPLAGQQPRTGGRLLELWIPSLSYTDRQFKYGHTFTTRRSAKIKPVCIVSCLTFYISILHWLDSIADMMCNSWHRNWHQTDHDSGEIPSFPHFSTFLPLFFLFYSGLYFQAWYLVVMNVGFVPEYRVEGIGDSALVGQEQGSQRTRRAVILSLSPPRPCAPHTQHSEYSTYRVKQKKYLV